MILGVIRTPACTIAKPEVGEKFSEFYITDIDKITIDYPGEQRAGERGSVIARIVNREHKVVTLLVIVGISVPWWIKGSHSPDEFLS